MVGLAVAAVAAPLLAGRQRRARAIGLVAAAGAVAAVYIVAFAPPAFLGRFGDTTGSGRTDIWTVGWRMVQAHPLLGVGAGNFPVSSIHYLLRPGALSFTAYIVDTPKVPHNIYLEVLAELGVVGLVGFLAVLVISLVCTGRAARRFAAASDRAGELLARGLMLALLALLTSQFFGSELYLKQLWLLLAMGPALLAVAERSAARGRAAGDVDPEPGSP
jgi:O-antigen ligase